MKTNPAQVLEQLIKNDELRRREANFNEKIDGITLVEHVSGARFDIKTTTIVNDLIRKIENTLVESEGKVKKQSRFSRLFTR